MAKLLLADDENEDADVIMLMFGGISACARGGRAHVRLMVSFTKDGASGKRAEIVELVRRASESGP